MQLSQRLRNPHRGSVFFAVGGLPLSCLWRMWVGDMARWRSQGVCAHRHTVSFEQGSYIMKKVYTLAVAMAAVAGIAGSAATSALAANVYSVPSASAAKGGTSKKPVATKLGLVFNTDTTLGKAFSSAANSSSGTSRSA